MKAIFGRVVLMTLIIVVGLNCIAQDNSKTLLKQVVSENEDAVNAIAMYPRETRKIIFEASEYPEVIAKLNSMQKNSQDAFENLIAAYSKDEQEEIWNLTRYVGFIDEITSGNKKSEVEIVNIVNNYPEEIHKAAINQAMNNYDLLVKIDSMNKNYNSDFELLLNGYSPEAINAFKEIIKYPEVLSILFDHMQYTVVIGDYYKKNPERVLHKTDSLNLVLTQKDLKETDDWKQGITDSSQVQEELNQAADEYAENDGYQPDDYNVVLITDVTNYTTTPYNWWFGYPRWYPYNYWKRFPYWYDWGFYYGWGGRKIFFGLPSSYFMEWFFYHPEHFKKYPELSNHFYNYYNNHLGSKNNNSISHNVNEWHNRNINIITSDWDKDNVNRIQRFKEFGQMEIDRGKYNVKHPLQQISQAEYLQKKQSKYPFLSFNVTKVPLIHNDTKSKPIQNSYNEPIKKPVVLTPQYYKAPAKDQIIINKQNNTTAKQTGTITNQENNTSKPNNSITNQESISSKPNTIITKPNNTTAKPQHTEYNNHQVNVETKQRPENVSTNSNYTPPPRQIENTNQIREAEQYHQNTWTQPQQQYIPPPQRQEESRPSIQPAQQNFESPSGGRRK